MNGVMRKKIVAFHQALQERESDSAWLAGVYFDDRCPVGRSLGNCLPE
jgi:hypothetical protein